MNYQYEQDCFLAPIKNADFYSKVYFLIAQKNILFKKTILFISNKKIFKDYRQERSVDSPHSSALFLPIVVSPALCPEICGILHSYIPIVIDCTTPLKFLGWVKC